MSIIYNGRDIGALYWNGSPTVGIYNGVKVWPTETGLPPYTIRLRFTEGVTPTFSKGTGVQVSASPNIWDLTYANTAWTSLLAGQSDLLEVIDANTTGVTKMGSMFDDCSALTSVSLFDTSKVTNMNYMFRKCSALTSVPLLDTSSATMMISMFQNCTTLITVPLFNTSKVTSTSNMFSDCSSLTSVPLFNTSSVTNMNSMFSNCGSLTLVQLFDTSKVTYMSYTFNNCDNVQSGALALYRQASSQATPPTDHTNTFSNCGIGTTTGLDELDQIPTDWGGLCIPVNFDD